jgi:hypothetical protein
MEAELTLPSFKYRVPTFFSRLCKTGQMTAAIVCEESFAKINAQI